ncbi:FKBP-type peptidyl-prolyl cis-trans isomerase [Candidatus Saccharibacteria bacterium TM7i]|nr:FKBP-type peptidyl-prolyl cis-trans isomerase [Candidatus Saccharibacteria bacterium TM7i]
MIALANKNDAADTARRQELEAKYQKEYDAYQAKKTAQDTELSNKYFATFSQYKDKVSTFDTASVKELGKEDLVVGEGTELTPDSSFTAYYLGWTPDGKIFDGSIDGEKLKAPFSVAPGSVIKGWSEGVVGMKTGGVRLLTIPSDKAYGESGSGDSIPPNTPLRFVVMVIPTPEVIAEPSIPEELYRFYQNQGMM